MTPILIKLCNKEESIYIKKVITFSVMRHWRASIIQGDQRKTSTFPPWHRHRVSTRWNCGKCRRKRGFSRPAPGASEGFFFWRKNRGSRRAATGAGAPGAQHRLAPHVLEKALSGGTSGSPGTPSGFTPKKKTPSFRRALKNHLWNHPL